MKILITLSAIFCSLNLFAVLDQKKIVDAIGLARTDKEKNIFYYVLDSENPLKAKIDNMNWL